MKIEFFQSPTLPFGSLVFFSYKTKKDTRWLCEVIDKFDYDKPLSFEDVCRENILVPLDISKDFENELAMKNWLMDNKFDKMYGNDDYEIFSKKFDYISRVDMKMNTVPFYAVYKKNNIF